MSNNLLLFSCLDQFGITETKSNDNTTASNKNGCPVFSADRRGSGRTSDVGGGSGIVSKVNSRGSNSLTIFEIDNKGSDSFTVDGGNGDDPIGGGGQANNDSANYDDGEGNKDKLL